MDNTNNTHKLKKAVGCLIGTIIVLAIVVSAFIIYFKVNEKLENSDFSININNTLTNIIVEITPNNCKIKTITYKITIYDNNNTIVNEQTYTQTNLTENETYQFTHKINASIFNANSYKVTFIKGKKEIVW